jgi:quercetin dioxygenase-like cupin family protein
MRPFVLLSCLVAAPLLVGCAGSSHQEKPVLVSELATRTTTASGQPIRLPQGDARIVLSEYTIAAGAKLPVHKHLSTRLAYVDAGSLAVTNTDTNETITYRPGDLIVEAVDQWHFAVNTGTTPVRLIVIDELVGDGPTTVLQQQDSGS